MASFDRKRVMVAGSSFVGPTAGLALRSLHASQARTVEAS
jgi:hypothetical protein